jgi:hypothetical protein
MGRGVTSIAGYLVRTNPGRCESEGVVVRIKNRVEETRSDIEAGFCAMALPAVPPRRGMTGFDRVTAGSAGIASAH